MMRNFRVFILVFASVLFMGKLRGQDSIRKGTWITVEGHYGFILPLYTSSMNILIQGHVPAFEVDYMNKPACQNNWLGAYHCPETGIAFFSAYLNNPAQLGNEFGLYPFVNFHLNKSYKERLYFRVGIGLAYMPVIFTRLDNHKNDVIGSHINAMFNFRLNYHFYLSDKLRLETGLGLTHCSNGAFQTPNLGINLITTNTGLSYNLASATHCPVKPLVDTSNIHTMQNVFIVSAGLSEIEPPGGQKYPDVSLSYIRYRRMNKKGKLGLGVDVFYNQANIARIKNDSVFLKNSLDITQFGVKASYELTLGKLSLPVEMGGYLYTNKYIGNGSIYNRIGMRYYAGKHFIANLTLLTHFVKADLIEWGVGYKL
jgi:hypothetical protein